VRFKSINKDVFNMLNAAITFFVIGLAAYLLGANGIAGLSMEAGKLLLMVFVVLAVASFVGNILVGRRSKRLT
jgi:uncharacterized membrane protein YtjA (UPF0391 family)